VAVEREEMLDQPASDRALGGILFAACMLVLVGAFQIIDGLVAIIDDNWYVIAPHYTYSIDTTVWGWIHLILGIVLVFGGVALFQRKLWAGILAIALASMSAILNFFFIPYYPFRAILIIAIDVFVIWSITRPDAMAR